jgi:cytochrome c oxidase subunit III
MSTRVDLDVSHLPTSSWDHRAPLWWGNLLLLFIETATVVLLIATYLYVWRNFPEFPPPNSNSVPPVYDTRPGLGASTANLLLLLLSCLPMYWTDLAARRLDSRRVMLGLGVMSLVAVASTILHFYEFPATKFEWNSNAYASVLWTTLGLHVIYVLAGLGEFLVMAAWTAKHGVDEKHGLDITLAGGYWYWVAGIWAVIYAVMYIGPRVLGTPAAV